MVVLKNKCSLMLITLQKKITPLMVPSVTVNFNKSNINTNTIPRMAYNTIVASQALSHFLHVSEPNTLLKPPSHPPHTLPEWWLIQSTSSSLRSNDINSSWQKVGVHILVYCKSPSITDNQAWRCWRVIFPVLASQLKPPSTLWVKKLSHVQPNMSFPTSLRINPSEQLLRLKKICNVNCCNRESSSVPLLG